MDKIVKEFSYVVARKWVDPCNKNGFVAINKVEDGVNVQISCDCMCSVSQSLPIEGLLALKEAIDEYLTTIN